MIELKALQAQVRLLSEDLRGQVAENAGLRSELRREYDGAERAERTASGFEAWLDDVLDQAAVAWVLACVFVRFCEDNALVGPRWIGGEDENAPAGAAIERRQEYVIANPRENDREWLREAFRYLQRLRATSKIFDDRNPVWRFDISGAAAEDLSEFFRKGPGRVSLRREKLDTRFLGDLYQDLSAYAKKTYALLQTPDFVEEFILDRTFEPAVREFGLSETSMIDPTCGSGHFLLGAFHRLVRRWREREPAGDIRVLTERALKQVTGVDINWFAVAIARFRLLIAAMQVCEIKTLERAPWWPLRVATGDSLLPWGAGKTVEQTDVFTWQTDKPFAYASEDDDLLTEYLRPGQYTVVVGNPPYITVSDSARSKKYRELYPTVCHRQYALTVPFAKRFFDLARKSDEHGDGAGYVGQITGNAFMKREFGKRLIENYFAHEVELTEIIDTSVAHIPGHGTPTVILIGRSNVRRRAPLILSVLGVRGEPSMPNDPAKGVVWQAILKQIDDIGSASPWISVSETPRYLFSSHPWSLSGGGSLELKRLLTRRGVNVLRDRISDWGNMMNTREDDAYCVPRGFGQRRAELFGATRPFVEGTAIRDWGFDARLEAVFPYNGDGDRFEEPAAVEAALWRTRSLLRIRKSLSGTQEQRGLPWYGYSSWSPTRYRSDSLIVFPLVATLPHFVYRRSVGSLFPQAATIIKLSESNGHDDYLPLLGVLNSSTACFWLKQVSHDKGIRGEGGGFTSSDWERFFEFTGTKLQEFPLPSAYPLVRGRELDLLAQRLSEVTPAAVAGSGMPSRERLRAARDEYERVRAQMIGVQEDLDFEVYRLYGLIDEDLTHPDPPGIGLGERAFEIAMAQQNVQTEWFNRHGSTPRDKVNPNWPADYRELVERRIAAIAANPHLALLERPEYKRRWATEGWDKMQSAALRDWLLDRLEAPEFWGGQPMPLSVAQLADRVRADADFRHVLDIWVGHGDYDLTKTLGGLVAEEHVPYLPADRYKATGLRKRALWERIWALQRREDAGESVEIDVPPKYTSADFLRHSFWRARGKLDVPKERFISYPKAGRTTDDSELLGWAGWDHVEQAQALATVYVDRKTQEAWPAHRLLPLLAGLVELEPWLHQWHAGERPGFPGSPAQFFTDFINLELSNLSSDRSALALLRGVPERP